MPHTVRRLAAIDLGTNSFHLVIADVKSNGKFTVLSKDKEVVRLGDSMTEMKHLSSPAIIRALETLRRFHQLAQSMDAPVRAIATSAVREALNRDSFLALVREELGFDIEVVSGFEEARLIYLGVLQALPVYRKRVLLVDIGGGSTEFLVGTEGDVAYVNSLKIGAVRLTRRFFADGTIKPRQVEECRAHLAGALDPIVRAIRKHPFEIAVGSSGTILNTASMILAASGVEIDDDPLSMTIGRKDLPAIVDAVLQARTLAKRKSLPGIDPGRADIIVAGILILEQVFEQLKLKEMTTSVYALREGILLDTIHKLAGEERLVTHLTDIRRASIYHLAESCHYEPYHAATVRRLALSLFDQLVPVHNLGKAEREYLEAAAVLHDIGYHISHAQHHKHSYYIIRHSQLLGFTDQEIEIIANVARYHRKSHPKSKHDSFPRLSERDQETVQALSALLRIADGLDRRHQDIFASMHADHTPRIVTIHLHLRRPTDAGIELWGAERRKELFEEFFRRSVRFVLEQN
jgi:exopolyphosphatase / guanosine-5'-triphosphate,3'-diphosphate pyrophosphatase